VNEITSLFGPAKHLVGTVAMPDAAGLAPVGFILLNSGVIHRVGPHRFNVKLAQSLARNGYASLRFDLSGQGDSKRAVPAIPFVEQAVADVRSAMDHLQRTVGTSRFAIVGLCSGAHHAISAAQVDDRITGLWMYDGFNYPTPKTRRVYYQQRLRTEGAASIRAWAAERISAQLRAGTRESIAEPVRPSIEYWQSAPPREEYGAMIRRLVQRGSRIFMMHSGSFADEYNYAGQFYDAFRDFVTPQDVRCVYRPDFDHTLTAVAAQREAIAIICKWAASAGGVDPR
jgi:dienelactone hydrolase